MGYLERFKEEQKAGKVSFSLVESAYRKRLARIYPRKAAAAEILLHAAWIAAAFFFALRISETSLPATAAVSLGGMLVALLAGRLIPLGLVVGGMLFILGTATLPFYLEAGPVGIFGLSCASKGFGSLYGKKLVLRWCLVSEEQFLTAVTEGTIEVEATGSADEGTRLLLRELEDATRPPEKAEKEGARPEPGEERSAGAPRAHVDFATAEQYFKRSLEVTEKEFGPDHTDVAAILNNLAALYRNEGDYASAEPLYRRSLAIREKALGPNHPDVATSLNNLGVLFASKSDYASAEPLYKRSLAIREKNFGPNHPEVAVSLGNLAVLCRATGREEEALRLEERAGKISGGKGKEKG